MFIALDKNNEKCYINEIIIDKNKDKKYFCPYCKNELIIKNGNIVIPHFAHKYVEDCDSFSHDMSQWHLDWQNKFPKENQEVIIELDINEMEYYEHRHLYGFIDSDEYLELIDEIIHGEKKEETKRIIHRADVCINNYVIEFQHSKISQKEFDERNWFYTKAGYKLIWIFDFIEEYNNKINYYEDWFKNNNSGGKYYWKNPTKIFSNFIPQKNKNIKMFFQISEDGFDADGIEYNYLEQIVWTIEEYEQSNFKRFFTSYECANCSELQSLIKYNKINIHKTKEIKISISSENINRSETLNFATDKQINYLQILCKEKSLKYNFNNLQKKEASAIIDYLLKKNYRNLELKPSFYEKYIL